MAMDDPWGSSPWADEIQNEASLPAPTTLTSQAVKPDIPIEAPLVLDAGRDDDWGNGDEGFGDWASLPVAEGAIGELGIGGDDGWELQHTAHDDGGLNEGSGYAIPWEDTPTIPVHSPSLLVPNLAPAIIREPSPDPWTTEITSNDGGEGKNRLEANTSGLEELQVEVGLTLGLDTQEPHEEHTALSNPGLKERDSTETQNGEYTAADGGLKDGSSEEKDAIESTSIVEVLKGKEVGMDQESLRSYTSPSDHQFVLGSESAMENPKGKGVESDQETSRLSSSHSDHEDVLDSKSAIENPKSKEIEVDHESSRPSSSPSDHEDVLPDSPRTSMEEDPKRPSMPRKVSSKVHELVQHFDGLTSTEIVKDDDLSVAGKSVDQSNILEADTNSEEDSSDDFGDFEDGHLEVVEDEATEDEAADRETISDAPMPNRAIESSIPVAADQSSPRSSTHRTLLKDYGRVQYSVPPSALDELYPSLDEEAPERVFVPDVIPHDSFSTVEQRKTWYRISRYGTMRKHNAGDDENYIRMNWLNSTIRTDTLDIVARWMEEDRISGRVVLGGGSKGSSLFGWNDPNAAAVPLAAAFAAKQNKKRFPSPAPVEVTPEIPREWPKRLVRTRSTSKTRTPPKARRRTSSRSKGNSEEIKYTVSPPVADFGWNSTGQPDSDHQVSVPLAKNDFIPPIKTSLRRPSSKSRTTALSPILSPAFPIQGNSSADYNTLASSAHPISSTVPDVTSAKQVLVDQDDDWGEMVSSPITAAPPFVPPIINRIRHKKSQSLVGQSTIRSSSSTNTPIPPLLSDLGHRPTSSMDKIQVPKPNFLIEPQGSVSLISPAANVDSSATSHTALPTATADPWAPANPNIGPSVTPHTTLPATTADPWASADFSFFESTPEPPPEPKAVPIPVPKPAAATAASFPVAIKGNGKTKFELEQDRIVASIVKSLPDLSYMLRR